MNAKSLSRQAINQLAEPASEVRLWSTRLKQAKQQSEVDKKESDRLAKELGESLENSKHDNIHTAMQSNGELMSQLRKRLQVQEALDKQIARREQLEEEALDLAVDEALPVERSFLMGILFVGGAFLFLLGLGKLANRLAPQPDLRFQHFGRVLHRIGPVGVCCFCKQFLIRSYRRSIPWMAGVVAASLLNSR